MDWIEVTGRTIDEARERALDMLGVDESELEYAVLEEPKTGFLGIGKTEARIRARVRPMSREKPNDRRRRRGRGREEKPRERAGERPERRGETARREPAAASRDGGEPGSGPARPARKRRRRGSGRGPGAAAGVAMQRGGERGEGPAKASATIEGETVSEASIPVEEQAEAAAAFTKELVGAFDLGARVKAEVVDEAVEVEVEGDQLGLLVGPKGATLAAIEELVRAAVQRSTGGHSARVHVDVAGYRRRRREALAAFARQQAEEVLASGAERSLEPMTAPDRKVVHDTIAELDGVTTTSEGEDPHRRVVIIPA